LTLGGCSVKEGTVLYLSCWKHEEPGYGIKGGKYWGKTEKELSKKKGK